MKTFGIKLTVTNTVLAIGLGSNEEIELLFFLALLQCGSEL